MPFRESHFVAGRAVALAEKKGCGLEDLPLPDLQAIDSRVTAAVFEVLGAENSARSRTSYGGTAPDNVRAQIQKAKERFLKC